MSNQSPEKSGVLFKNEKKTGNQPDYTGNITLDGVKCKLAAWVKTAKNDAKFLSIKISDPMDQRNEEDQNESAANSNNGNDLPF